MARYQCPSCGAAYNGRKCRDCLYEHFTEEIAHGNHTHAGEPLVIDAPVRRPVKRKDPFGCEKKTRKRRPLAGFVTLLVLINAVLPMLRNWGMELEAMENSYIAPEPEPEIPIPANARVLYQDEEIYIAAGWQENQEFIWDFPVYVRNDSDREIAVAARNIQINGYMMEDSYLYCYAEPGTTEMGIFVFAERDKVNAGILAVEEISFTLEILDAEEYETITETPAIELTAAVPEGAATQSPPVGETVFAQDGIRVSFLGFAYSPSAYDPYSFEDGALLFHIENDTQRHLYCNLDETALQGKAVDLGLWCELPPGTKAVSSVYLYGLEEEGFSGVEDLGQFTFCLEIGDWEDYEFRIRTDPITVSVAEKE